MPKVVIPLHKFSNCQSRPIEKLANWITLSAIKVDLGHGVEGLEYDPKDGTCDATKMASHKMQCMERRVCNIEVSDSSQSF